MLVHSVPMPRDKICCNAKSRAIEIFKMGSLKSFSRRMRTGAARDTYSTSIQVRKLNATLAERKLLFTLEFILANHFLTNDNLLRFL